MKQKFSLMHKMATRWHDVQYALLTFLNDSMPFIEGTTWAGKIKMQSILQLNMISSEAI